ncbi:MAG: hypothetical protein EBQ56_10085 [Proteobacteria bacterium]|nr:hypothetical protein [Actinomycetota bacterium]NBY48097.1 hypothetical protein [Pseudomonadota bacterium]
MLRDTTRSAMLVVHNPAMEARPCNRQVAAAVGMAPASQRLLQDCVPELPLRHRPDGAFGPR